MDEGMGWDGISKPIVLTVRGAIRSNLESVGGSAWRPSFTAGTFDAKKTANSHWKRKWANKVLIPLFAVFLAVWFYTLTAVGPLP